MGSGTIGGGGGSATVPSPGSWTDPADKATKALPIVQSHLESVKSWADTAFNEATGFLSGILGRVFTITVDVATYTHPADPGEIALTTPTRPTLTTPTVKDIAEPQTPTFTDVTVTPPDAPVFDGVKPEFNYPDMPTWDVPSVPTAPVLNSPALPTKSILPYPDAPELAEIVFPAAPDLLLIPFDGVYPVDTLNPPGINFLYTEDTYDSALKAALSSKLLDMVNGASGLDPDVEQAIYDRDDERFRLEEEAQYDEAAKYFESRGCTLPDGALVARLDSVREQIARRRTDRSNAIRVESFERADKILQFALAQGVTWESRLIDYANAIAQRVFDAEKATCEFLIQGYELARNTYLTRLEVVKIKAQVTETSARVAAAQADIFRTQMEAANIQASVQKNQVDLYLGEMQAVKISADIYNTELQGTLAELEVEKQKLEQFKYLIDAFTAQVQAKTSEFNAYAAGMAGEGEKARVYLADAQVYNSMVEAYKAKATTAVEIGRFGIEKNKFSLDTYLGMLEAMKAKVQKAVSEAEITSKINGDLVNLYQAASGVYGEQIRYAGQRLSALVEDAKNAATVSIANMEKKVDAVIAAFQMQVEIAKAAASAYSQITAASLSSGTASAQIGYHEDVGDRTQISKDMQQSIGAHNSYSESSSESSSESVQVIYYNYNET